MKMLLLEVTATVLVIVVWLTIAGCERRTDTAETKGQNAQEDSRSARQKGTNIQDIGFEILHEKEIPTTDGDKLMMVIILLQEHLSEEGLLSFVGQMYDNYRAYENLTIQVVASRAVYEAFMKQSRASDSDLEVMDRNRIIWCTRVHPPLDNTLYGNMLRQSGTPRSDGYEYLWWGEKAVDGRRKGLVTTLDGRTVLYDPKDWNVKSDSMGCHIQWSWSVDTPGRVSIRGKAVNLLMEAQIPNLQVSVKDPSGTVVSKSDFELPRFKGMRMFETCVLAYSFPWDLRDGQTVELNVVELSAQKPEPVPQPDPNLPQTKVESTPVLYRTADAVKNSVKEDSGFSYTLFEGPKVGIYVKQLDRNPQYKTIETWEVQLAIRIDQHLFSPGTPDTITCQMKVEVEHTDPQTYLRQEDGLIIWNQRFVYGSEPSSYVNYTAGHRTERGWIRFPYVLVKGITEDGLAVRIGDNRKFARTLTIPKYYIDGFVRFAEEKVIPYAPSDKAPD